jgi:hypothetical protein
MIGRKNLSIGIVALLAGSYWATSAPAQTHSFTGRGHRATRHFNLDEGLTTFNFRHAGRSNFIAWLLDSDGNRVALVANGIGYCNGSNAVRIEHRGSYLLNVTADGQWTISKSVMYHNPFVQKSNKQTPAYSTRSAQSSADILRRPNSN